MNIVNKGFTFYICIGKWGKPKISFTVTRSLRICLGFISINIGFWDLESWHRKILVKALTK